MAKRPKPGKCVHCLSHADEMTWDHVFPLSWYPDSTPANVEKWKIPSCVPCNASYGRLEDDFRMRVALCLEPDDPTSSSIVDDVMRSVSASSARSERDRAAREARRQTILSEVMQGADIPDEATYPGLGERWGRPLEEREAISLPVDYVQRMTEKIVRGLFYIEDRKFIEPPHKIEHLAVYEDSAQEIRDLLDRFGETYARPPGLVVRRAVVPADGVSSLFEIVFWRQFKCYATVRVPH